MNKNIKEFLGIIKERGFIHQTTDLESLSKRYKRSRKKAKRAKTVKS